MENCGFGRRCAFSSFVSPRFFFCLWVQVWELVWVGDGFLPELVGEVARREARGLAVDERRAVLAGAGLGLGLRCAGSLVFGFGQDIYDLELWWRMWPYNEPPLVEHYKRKCARLRFLFFLLLLFSLSLLLFRREVGCWAATDCPDVQSELYLYILKFSFLRCLGSDCWTGAQRSC